MVHECFQQLYRHTFSNVFVRSHYQFRFVRKIDPGIRLISSIRQILCRNLKTFTFSCVGLIWDSMRSAGIHEIHIRILQLCIAFFASSSGYLFSHAAANVKPECLAGSAGRLSSAAAAHPRSVARVVFIDMTGVGGVFERGRSRYICTWCMAKLLRTSSELKRLRSKTDMAYFTHGFRFLLNIYLVLLVHSWTHSHIA